MFVYSFIHLLDNRLPFWVLGLGPDQVNVLLLFRSKANLQTHDHFPSNFQFQMSVEQGAFKVVFLGESGTGKTSLISRYIDRTFSGTLAPTVGCAGRTVECVYRDRTVNLLIWDTAGQELYRSLTPIYYRNATAAVVVFDITARETFDQVQGWVEELRAVVDDIVLVICGNKIDLEEQREVDGMDGAALAASAKAAYVEASAKEGLGLEQLFQTVVKEVSDRKPYLLERPAPVRSEAKSECC
jgi:small GTP-binding protein